MPRIIAERVLKRTDVNDDRIFDKEFWKSAGHEVIFSSAWEMTDEVLLIRGQNASESRLQRHIQNIRRRES